MMCRVYFLSGMILERESDAKFEERVTVQADILKQQIDMYELEERTLEVKFYSFIFLADFVSTFGQNIRFELFFFTISF